MSVNVLIHLHCSLAFAEVYRVHQYLTIPEKQINTTFSTSGYWQAVAHWPCFNLNHKYHNCVTLKMTLSWEFCVHRNWKTIFEIPSLASAKLVVFCYLELTSPQMTADLWTVIHQKCQFCLCGFVRWLIGLSQVNFLSVKKVRESLSLACVEILTSGHPRHGLSSASFLPGMNYTWSL